jgi:hypothetical protein
MKRSPQDHQDEEIIKILKSLSGEKVEYPPELLAARRAAFAAQVEQTSKAKIKNQLPLNGQFTKRLKELKSVRAEYPPELLAAQRAAFIAQVEQHTATEMPEELISEDQEIVELFSSLKSLETEYPPELLAARRAAFIARVEQHTATEVPEELISEDQEIIKLFSSLKSLETDYPPNLIAARRSAFVSQIAQANKISILDALRSSIQNIFRHKIKLPSIPKMEFMRTSLVIAALMVATFVGSLLGNSEQLSTPFATQGEIAQPALVLATSTLEEEDVICKPGYVPPLCLAKESNHEENLTFQGNGSARPAVAKDTLPGYSGVHKAAYVNDGLYGPGASWVSKSAYSWIKIDLGKATTINTVAFGRDRLGNLNDRDPGQFVIAVALSDNVYSDGNSSNDLVEYIQVYDSIESGFSGIVSGSETIRAQFGPVMARFVKITFVNPGTAVDEVEVFMVQPPLFVSTPTRKPKDDLPAVIASFMPSSTPAPTDTATPIPTDTPLPTNTPEPTDTPQPTDTSIPDPTNTPRPTKTPTAVPTDPPQPTDTPIPPPPTNTEEPIIAPTETPLLVGVP